MIRKYQPTDEDQVLDVWYQASIIAHHFLLPVFLEQEINVIRQTYLPVSETWIYEENQEIVGFLSFEGSNTIGGLFVTPSRQRQGIGTKLMAHAKSLRPNLYLDVFKQNENARRFYQKCGFRVIAESINQETGCPQFTMKWQKPPNIVLTGFMGVGKSSVGRLLAMELNRKFIDMDTLIEQRQKRAINQIFADEGEPYFRQLEADLCRELAQKEGLVIATGGGALVPQENLRVMEQGNIVICLDCRPDVLWKRIGRSQNRPMLAANDQARVDRLAALLEKRAPAYARIQHHVDVTQLSRTEVVQQILQSLQLKINR